MCICICIHICIYNDIYVAGFLHFLKWSKFIRWNFFCFSKHKLKIRLKDKFHGEQRWFFEEHVNSQNYPLIRKWRAFYLKCCSVSLLVQVSVGRNLCRFSWIFIKIYEVIVSAVFLLQEYELNSYTKWRSDNFELKMLKWSNCFSKLFSCIITDSIVPFIAGFVMFWGKESRNVILFSKQCHVVTSWMDNRA